MKTQCPTCKEIQEIPDTYKDQQVKCTACNAPFTANVQSDPKPDTYRSLRKRIDIALSGFFYVLGRACLVLILGIVFISVVYCALSFDGGSLASIQYLLAVAAFCLMLITIELLSKK